MVPTSGLGVYVLWFTVVRASRLVSGIIHSSCEIAVVGSVVVQILIVDLVEGVMVCKSFTPAT